MDYEGLPTQAVLAVGIFLRLSGGYDQEAESGDVSP